MGPNRDIVSSSPVWHPFTQHGLGEPIPCVTHARGASLFTAEGREVLDMISSWWVTTHGHAHPRIAAAIAEQAGRLDQLIFAGWTHAPAEELARALVGLAPPGLDHVFFSDSGSTAVEVAIKMALGYWGARGEPRHRVLVLEHGYHGDTIGAMSAGHRGAFNRRFEPLLFEVGVIPFPHPGAEQRTLDTLERECRGGAALFLVEPLALGAGGMLFYPPRVLAEMRAICSAHGVPFAADEVMTGWGRTGSLFACEQAGVAPDLLCVSKGLTGGSLPLAATLATEPFFAAHYGPDRASMFFHSSSYTANPIACAAANANLAIWRDEPVTERVAALSAAQAAHVARLADHPRVSGTRALGTIAALEIGAGEGDYLSELGPKLLAFFRDRHLLIRPLGNTVYLMPPYCITEAQLDRAWEVVEEAAETI